MRFNDYQFTLVQIRKAMSGEIFNIGVIGIDKATGQKEFKHIEDLDRVSKCLKIGDTEHLAFTMGRISTSIKDSIFSDIPVSSDVYVSHMVPYRHKGDLSSAVQALFEKNMTIIEHEDHHLSRSIHDKQSIVERLRTFGDIQKYNNIHYRKKTQYTVKNVDVVVFDETGKVPVVAGEVASLFVHDPSMTMANSLMTLQTLKNSKVMGRILNVPLLEKFTSPRQKELYDWARNMAEAEHHSWVDSKDPAEFFGVFERLSEEYGGIIHIEESSLIGG